MCGIVGFAGRCPIEPERLRTMTDALTHRGPDDSGIWYASDHTIALGHRRLAIIDLSAGGHQPMADRAATVHIAFNGEIYNYREVRAELAAAGHQFRSASDTEVILEAYREWGEDFLRRLNGQFAMALFDEERRRLYLARDRAGEKPLFIWKTPQRLVFASELKAILTLPDAPRKLDRLALEQFLAWGYVPGESCILEGIRKLEPASVMRVDVDSGETRTWRYWDLPEYSANGSSRAHDDALVGELETLLLDSVRRQMVADVPVGILLSGGIDSSLITAMAARVSSRPVKTFTVTFPGSSLDESAHARVVAQHFGTDHSELEAEDASVDVVGELARQYDEPIADSSMVPTYLVSRLIRKHATVALGGDGGDELFGGYASYSFAIRSDLLRRAVPDIFRPPLGAAARRLPPAMRGRNAMLSLAEKGFDSIGRMNVFFGPEWRGRLLGRGVNEEPERLKVLLSSGAKTMLQAAQRIDFRSYMVDDILVKVDRASMLTSLEVRAPFLDPSIIEFAFRKVPDRQKTTFGERKVLLRRLAAKLLPPQFDLRRKQGFSVPLADWFKGSWGEMMRDVLISSDSIFNREAIEALFAGQATWRNQAHRLFGLAVFELWRREYSIGG